jgi:hypothetical protein
MRSASLLRARIAIAVAAAAAAAVLAVSAPAQAQSGDEAQVLALSNGLRASVGAPALTFDESLSNVARAWAAKMAAAGTISHNPGLTGQVSGWSKLSENVGMGGSIQVIHDALVASHSHYVNLVDTEVTLIGIGVVRSGNAVFIVENFMKPKSAAPAVTSAPATTPTTKAAPTVASTPTTRPPAPTTAAGAPEPVAAPVPVASSAPSEWLTLAIEMTRSF